MTRSKIIVCVMIIALLNIPVMVAATDWPSVNYDTSYSRNSPQTVIGKSNVNQLEAKWVFNTNYPIENTPLIVGNRVYVQNNALQIFALDLNTGVNVWKYDPNITYQGGLLPRVSTSHGMTYGNGVLYAPTGPGGTVIALDANTGAKIWETDPLDNGPAFRNSAPPVFANGIVIGGSALGDEPPFGVAQKGTVTGIDQKTGKKLWQTVLAIGDWVTTNPNARQNGGATTWTGGAIDTERGVVFLPIGNPSPDFKPELRSPGPNLYADHVIAVNMSDGKVLWYTPFVAEGTVIPGITALPDGHDWDCSWGTNLATVDMGQGPQKVVIGHTKRGDIMALDAMTGKPLWWVNLIYLQNENQQPSPQGTDIVWPGPSVGIEAFTATDGKYVYAAASNQPVIYYNQQPASLNGTGILAEGGAIPAFNAIDNGFCNGSINAVDLKTGKVAWSYPTKHGTFVSPVVSNGVVYSGELTDTGKPFTYSDFAGPVFTPLLASGMLYALDADTGKLLWQFNVGAQVGIGGPSIGNGYLIVPTGGITTNNNGGYVMAFGLPSGTAGQPGSTQSQNTPTAGLWIPTVGIAAFAIAVIFMRRKDG